MRKGPGLAARIFLLVPAFMAGNIAGLQAQTAVEQPEYRQAVLSATLKKIQTGHFSPRAIDDSFSVAVWKNYLQTLDPNRNVFIEADIDRLQPYKYSIDDQLKNGASTYFDTVWAIYHQRLAECKLLYPQVLNSVMDLEKKETVVMLRKEQPYPATVAERKDLWRRMMKFYVLKNYYDLLQKKDTVKGEKITGLQPALEAKAREKVRKWFDASFKQLMATGAHEEKFYQYVNTVAVEIDPHTNFMGPKESKNFAESMSKRYYGLGLELNVVDADVYIKRLVPGGSAFKSGKVFENDRIIAVADSSGKMISVDALSTNDVSGLIKGDKGTVAKLILKNGKEPERTVSIPRDEINETATRAKSAIVMKNGKKIGYIYLPLFYKDLTNQLAPGCAADMQEQLQSLKEQGVEAIVIDLRGNPGGALDEVVKIAGSYLGAGAISVLRGRDSIRVYGNQTGEAIFKGPLTVMVDESSASASEILAAAVQDWHRGLVIGTSSSFGKGTAQITTPLGTTGDPARGTPALNFGTLRLTQQKFYRVNGATTQLRGVIPDIVLQQRMNANSIMEKDYPSALISDTLTISGYQPSKWTFNYELVMKNAKQRVAGNTALQSIGSSMEKLASLQRSAYELDRKQFGLCQQQIDQLEETIRKARELQPGSRLQVEPNLAGNKLPAISDPVEKKRYDDWLLSLQKDLYLAETISVLEDMIANPM